MGNVYANGLEVSAKVQANKSIAAMPSVCMSPPSPPAGPVPIPYPVTALAPDTEDGTGSVQIGGKEVGKKNGSVYSSCNGNQPATRSFGMDVASHTLEGKTKFEAYSFDVMFEKGGAERFTDLTTSNHSNTGTATTSSVAGGTGGPAADPECVALQRDLRAMRQATDMVEADRAELKRASDMATLGKRADVRKRGESWMRDVMARINERAQGALTSSNVGGQPRRYAAYASQREALRQRNIAVQDPGAGGTNSNVCGGSATDYAEERDKRHTEAQMLEQIPSWNPPPASVTFATSWPARTPTGQPDPQSANRPCPLCRTKLVEACGCGLKIYMCVGNTKTDYCADNA